MPADRITGRDDLTLLLDLGMVPVGGIYWPGPAGTVVSAPLRLAVSSGSRLVQLQDRYDASLYAGYAFSGLSSPAYARHVIEVAAWFAESFPAPARLFEIGASDGVLLGWFAARGWRAEGIEPSAQLVGAAAERGVAIIHGYATAAWAGTCADAGRCDAIVLRHVLEHLDDPNDMLLAIGRLAAPQARLLLELPSLEDMVGQRLFSNLVHEHVAYYSQEVLWSLLARHGWGVTRYRRVAIHGGSHLLECARGPHALQPTAWDGSALHAFVADLGSYRTAFRALVAAEHAAGRRIAVHGAGPRTALLLSLGGLDAVPLVAIFDGSRLLHGLHHPPHGTPIRDPAALRREEVDTVVVAAIAHQDDILAALSGFRAQGGRVITLAGAMPRLLVP